MNSLCVRVTISPELDKEALFIFFNKYKVIGCHEYPHNNPHYHFWCLTDLKHDTFQKSLKKIPGVAGDKFSVKSTEGVLKYLCKGPKAVSKLKAADYPGEKVYPEIVINTMGITEDSIKNSHEEWWAEAKDWKSKKTKNEKINASKKEKINWFETLMLHVKSKGCTCHSDGWEIAKWIIDAYRVYVKCEPNDFQIKCYAKSIQRELVYEYSKQCGSMNIYDGYLRERAKVIIGSEWTHVRI